MLPHIRVYSKSSVESYKIGNNFGVAKCGGESNTSKIWYQSEPLHLVLCGTKSSAGLSHMDGVSVMGRGLVCVPPRPGSLDYIWAI
jgi:hypothetical protein